jgi:predicted RNA binding protein YcfA (HicA-like mRNA interferase family)
MAQRIPLGAVYFADRRKLIQKLRATLGGGQEVTGGRHPIFLAPDGTRTPIPYGKQVDEGTLGNILKQLKIQARPRDFMSG